jgi:hypothetical protein
MMEKRQWIPVASELPERQINCLVSVTHYPMAQTIGGAAGEDKREIALATFIPAFKQGGRPIFLTHSTSEDMNNVLFNDGKILADDGRCIAEITAWMRLPDPYDPKAQ